MVGCQVVAIRLHYAGTSLRSVSLERDDAQVQVAGQCARTARVLRRDERERSEATAVTLRAQRSERRVSITQKHRRRLRSLELARVASKPRREEQELVDLVRGHCAARSLRWIECVADHRQQSRTIAGGAWCDGLCAHGPPTDHVDAIVAVVSRHRVGEGQRLDCEAQA